MVPSAVRDLRKLVGTFANQLSALIEHGIVERARTAVESALGGRRPGRPPKALFLVTVGKRRKKAPVQLCPVPDCKNPAAPVFGMVCSDHKDVPKAKNQEVPRGPQGREGEGLLQGPQGDLAEEAESPP